MYKNILDFLPCCKMMNQCQLKPSSSCDHGVQNSLFESPSHPDKIIYLIIKKKVVQKILVHLKLWDDPTRQWPPPAGKAGSTNSLSNP